MVIKEPVILNLIKAFLKAKADGNTAWPDFANEGINHKIQTVANILSILICDMIQEEINKQNKQAGLSGIDLRQHKGQLLVIAVR